MSWTYKVARVASDGNEYYHMVEWYDMESGPVWSAEPEYPIGETIDEVIWELKHMLKAARRAKLCPGLILNLDEKGDRA